MAATYGTPPCRNGFHSGIPFPARSHCSAKTRNPYPLVYWSLRELKRIWPVSPGQDSVRVASAKTSDAHSLGRAGSKSSNRVSGLAGGWVFFIRGSAVSEED